MQYQLQNIIDYDYIHICQFHCGSNNTSADNVIIIIIIIIIISSAGINYCRYRVGTRIFL